MPKPVLTDQQKDRAMDLLRAEAARLGDKAAVAKRLGLKRSAISMVMAGTYPARPDGVLAAALAVLDQVECPYLGEAVAPSLCSDLASGPVPTWNPPALSHRRACQTCPHRPKE